MHSSKLVLSTTRLVKIQPAVWIFVLPHATRFLKKYLQVYKLAVGNIPLKSFVNRGLR
jgi:hypothetical protein